MIPHGVEIFVGLDPIDLLGERMDARDLGGAQAAPVPRRVGVSHLPASSLPARSAATRPTSMMGICRCRCPARAWVPVNKTGGTKRRLSDPNAVLSSYRQVASRTGPVLPLPSGERVGVRGRGAAKAQCGP